jgi:hypothetical protein
MHLIRSGHLEPDEALHGGESCAELREAVAELVILQPERLQQREPFNS